MIYCPDCRFRMVSNLRSGGFYCAYHNAPSENILGCECGESKIITNADRIRAMSDESLADFFNNEAALVPWCDMSCVGVKGFPCRKCIFRWLKQEVSDG